MQRVLGITIFSLGVLAPRIAPAQTPPRPPKGESARPAGPERGGAPIAGYQQVRRYDFDNDDVTGTLVRPDDLLVSGGGKAKHRSLVEPRGSFLPEMIKSAGGL